MNDTQHYRELPGLEALGEMDAVEARAFEDATRRMDVLRDLVTWRKQCRLSQQVVAEWMDTTQSAVSELESGRIDPRLSTLQRYARALGKELHVMIGEVGTPQGAVAPGVFAEEYDKSFGLILRSLLQAQYTYGSRSADRLVEQTGLPAPVVDRALSSLSAHEWIRKISDGPERSRLVTLNAERAQVIGISVREDHVRGVITTLRTEAPLAIRQLPLPSGEPADFVEAVKSLVASLIDAGGDRRLVLGLGVEIAGLVDDELGIVLHAPDLEPRSPLWRNFSLESELQRATGLRTVVGNDADALAVYEYLRRGDTSDLAVVLMSESCEGIGSGLIYDGRLLHGRSGISGEIGHVLINRDGEQCRFRHQRGCLETVASAAAVVRHAGIEQKPGMLAQALTEAADRVQRGDRAAVEAFRAAGQGLGRVLTNLTSVLAPSLIVIYGQPEFTQEPGLQSAEVFVSAIKDALSHGWFSQDKLQVNVVTRELDPTAGPRGAASVAVSHFLDRPLRWLSTPDIPDDELHDNVLARSA